MSEKTDYLGPIRNILLATDGSASSAGAIREALYLAKSCVAKLSVIYVLETNPELETEGLAVVEKMEDAAREHLDNVRGAAAAENVEIEAIVRRTDQPYKAIVEEAEQRKVDVIVMGRRGRSGLEKVLLGSVTSKVIGYSPANVFVVPQDAKVACKKILVATDGSRNSEVAVSKAIDIAKRCGSSLVILHVVPSELLASISPDTGYTQKQLELLSKEMGEMTERSLKNAKALAEKEGIPTEEIVLGGNAYEVIVETAKKKDVDLIIVGSHGRTGLKKLIMGSVTERVIVLSPFAVLVVKV